MVWLGKVFLLCHVTVLAFDIDIDLLLIKFMGYTPLLYEVERVLCCIDLMCSTPDDLDEAKFPALMSSKIGTLEV